MEKNYIPIFHSTVRIMVGYYDYVLGLVPLTLLGLTGLLFVGGLQLTTAVPLGAGVSGLVVGHALFVNGPVDPTEITHQAAPVEAAEASTAVPEQA
jgi:hypothetical protein